MAASSIRPDTVLQTDEPPRGGLDPTGPRVVLDASGLAMRFGARQVLADLSFRVGRGQAFGLLGPNGAGKTTTVRLLTGLLTPNHGSVTLFGEPVTPASADRLRQRIGVQTDTNLYERLTARENLRAWGALYGIRKGDLDRRISELLSVLGLAERANSPVGEFSKGMRQKLSVGRAVMHQPELLFLDEPTAGLDPEAAADLIAYLKEMIRSLNTTVILCTHQLHGLETLCDEIGILKDGRLLAVGSVPELLRRTWPEQRYLVRVTGDHASARTAIASATGREPDFEAPDFAFAVADPDVIPSVVSALVAAGIAVNAVVPQTRTVEELYFATLEQGSRS